MSLNLDLRAEAEEWRETLGRTDVIDRRLGSVRRGAEQAFDRDGGVVRLSGQSGPMKGNIAFLTDLNRLTLTLTEGHGPGSQDARKRAHQDVGENPLQPRCRPVRDQVRGKAVCD